MRHGFYRVEEARVQAGLDLTLDALPDDVDREAAADLFLGTCHDLGYRPDGPTLDDLDHDWREWKELRAEAPDWFRPDDGEDNSLRQAIEDSERYGKDGRLEFRLVNLIYSLPISGPQKLTYLALRNFASPHDGLTRKSYQELADLISRDKRTARRAVRELRNLGLVNAHHLDGRKAKYSVHMPMALADLAGRVRDGTTSRTEAEAEMRAWRRFLEIEHPYSNDTAPPARYIGKSIANDWRIYRSEWEEIRDGEAD